MLVPMAVMSDEMVSEDSERQARALDVEDLAAEGQDGLRLTIARLLRRATCGVALDDEDLGFGSVFG